MVTEGLSFLWPVMKWSDGRFSKWVPQEHNPIGCWCRSPTESPEQVAVRPTHLCESPHLGSPGLDGLVNGGSFQEVDKIYCFQSWWPHDLLLHVTTKTLILIIVSVFSSSKII